MDKVSKSLLSFIKIYFILLIIIENSTSLLFLLKTSSNFFLNDLSQFSNRKIDVSSIKNILLRFEINLRKKMDYNIIVNKNYFSTYFG